MRSGRLQFAARDDRSSATEPRAAPDRAGRQSPGEDQLSKPARRVSFAFGFFRCEWQLGSRRRAMSLCKWLSLAAVLSLAAGVAVAAPTPLKATNTWMGSIDDEKLAKEMPKNGVITNAKDFEKLVKAWKVAEKVREVNFDKEIVLVAKTEGSK